MPPPKKPRCRDAPWFFLAREGLSARPEWARNRRWTMPCNVSVRGAFQLTPSARRATYQLRLARERTDYFNPRPPRGGRPVAFGFSHIRVLISIHALREEGDVIATAPAGWIWDFNPRPPRGERQRMISDIEDMMQISIHALREESDLQKQGYKRRMVISIHALREEGDRVLPLLCMLHKIFRSTPSARRATRPSPASRRSSTYFNPRPPRGGRHGAFSYLRSPL